MLARFGLSGAWVSMRVRGEVKGAGTVRPLALRGTAALELADFRVLDHAWDRPQAGTRPILEFRRAVEPVFDRLYDSVKAGNETRIVLAANSAPDYKQKLEIELREMRESEMWQTGAAVRSLRPENWKKSP